MLSDPILKGTFQHNYSDLEDILFCFKCAGDPNIFERKGEFINMFGQRVKLSHKQRIICFIMHIAHWLDLPRCYNEYEFSDTNPPS